MARARAVAEHAYAPYSNVRVGAALLTKDGRVFVGTNVENASFGLTICAERAAVFTAVTEGATELRSIAIWSSLERPLPPCGACRQVLSEFAPSLEVWWTSGDAEPVCSTLDELLSHQLAPDDVRRAGGSS